MPRAIRYRDARSAEPAVRGQAARGEEDGYGAKLVKYVPAETLAFLVPIAPTTETQAQRWFVAVAATVGTLVYVIARGDRRRVTVVLALVSLWAWIAGTTDLAMHLFDLSKQTGRLVMATAVFLLPAIDELVNRAPKD